MNEKKLPKATHSGAHIGPLPIPCYVLEDGRSFTTTTAAFGALSIVRRGARGHGDGMASFLGSNALKPFSGAALAMWTNATEFVLPQGGITATGCDARVLVEIAGAIDDADRAGALGVRYTKIAASARALLRSLAGVAIDALVHEATGYDKVRPDGDLEARFTASLAAQERRLEAKFSGEIAKRDDQITALTAKLDEKDEVELELVGVHVMDGSALGRSMSERRHLSDTTKNTIKQRKAEAQERRDKRRGQTYIFTLRRPRPSEMANGGAA